ncbi:MAG: hypothetical protein A3E87_00415 [Gammaproteobacteria bacterium RIFCSPHIGHO2_12_FULL_35_23]|nr:MAG: hypothetical protein A3E87_00415 [Gammaproteobacteria bacterium RIFCSPHIGHO2_12_FULL_35_23]
MSIDKNKVYSLGLGFVTSKVLFLAAKLNLDHYLSDKPVSIVSLAEKLNFDQEAFKRFLRILDAYELIKMDEKFVSKTVYTNQLQDLKTPHLTKNYRAFDQLEYTLQTHKPCWDKEYGQAFYPSLGKEELTQFADWCRKSGDDWLLGVFALYDFSKFKKLVDVGGGQGHFLAEVLSRNTHQEGILLDQPEVVAGAKEVLAHKNCLNRVSIIGGDFFKQVPDTGDCYLLCRVLLNWNDEKAVSILNSCYHSMSDKTKLLVIDFILPDKSHPHYLRTALSDLNLLGLIDSKNRNKTEWRYLVEQSRLKLNKIIISDSSLQPEPFAPIVILECTK